MANLLKYLEENQSQMVEDIENIVKAESPTLDKSLADQCADALMELFRRRLGVEAEIIPQQQVGDHLRFSYGSGARQLLILTHYDTVWDKGALGYRVEGNKAYGPGIFDMKGGIIQVLWALKAFQDSAIDLKRKVVILCTSDEEISSPTSRYWIEQEAAKSEAVFVTEPAAGREGAIKTARKGVGSFAITMEGKASHAGSNHEEGISAIEEMTHQIRYIHSLTDYNKGTTLNVGVAKGGTRANVVAEHAEIHVDLRVSDVEEGERITALIHNLKPVHPGISIHIEGGMTRPPMEKKHTEHLFQIARHCAEELGIELTEKTVGAGSDGSFTAALGVPTLDGLGLIGDGLHAKHEHILLDQIALRTALLSKLIARVAMGI